MISQIKKRTLEDLDINHSGFAWTEGHTQVSFALVQEGGVEEVLSDDVVVNDNTIYGAVSKDAIHGLSGNDALNGGAGTITDSDGQGTIQIDGQTIGTAKGAGKRGVWVAEVGAGQYVGLSVYDNQSSTTGKKLVITRAGSTDNTITIDNFDLAKALSSEGYLGIKLDPTQRVALVQGTGSDVGASTPNVWADNTFKASSLESQSSDVVEANGKSFNIYLAQAAHAGAQGQRRVSLNAADSRYRIRSCLRPFLLGCRVIGYKNPVQCAQTQRAYGWCGRRRPDARSEMTR